MPRANLYHLPGDVWHLTARCPRQQGLLRFARDRRAWVHWLYEARHRFGLCVLNYQVTSNHVHLLVQERVAPVKPAKARAARQRWADEFVGQIVGIPRRRRHSR